MTHNSGPEERLAEWSYELWVGEVVGDIDNWSGDGGGAHIAVEMDSE